MIVASQAETWVYRLWDGVQLDRLPSGGVVAVGEGMLVVTKGRNVHAYAWQ